MERAIKNVTAERIVVGILLNNPEWLVELNGIMHTDFFFQKGNKLLFHIISTLLRDGAEIIDSFTILARAERYDKGIQTINENGGIEYIEELKMLAQDYTLQELKRYSGEVAGASFKRDLLVLNDSIEAVMTQNPDMTIGDISTYEQERKQELMSKYASAKQVSMIGEVFDQVWSEIEANRGNDGIVGYPSKIPMANRYFTYMNGELVVIGARAKYGKSNFAINEAHNLAVVHGIPVAIFDTEMKTRTFLSRILALDSGVTIRAIMSGSYVLDEDMLNAVERSKELIRKAPLFHVYDPYWDKAKVSHKAKLLKLRYNLGMLIYDYIKVKEVGFGVKEHSELGNWTIFLKDLAGDLDIPILTFGQLSPVDRRLADSDKINRYASTIAYLLPKTPKQIAEQMWELGGADMLWVDYNRNGSSMTDEDKGINLAYDRAYCKIEQAPYQILDDEYM